MKTKLIKSKNEFQLAMDRFKRNRLAVWCWRILLMLYAVALFADFLAPYSFNNEDRRYSYAPPTKIHFMEDGKFTRPYVYVQDLAFDEYYARIYKEDTSKKYELTFLPDGDAYGYFGIDLGKKHLFGVADPARIYLFGADSRGRDLLSRLFHGARISLSVGLIGVMISFSIGLFVGGIAGFYGGKIDNFLMRVCEFFMLVPGFYLLLALRAAVPDDFNSVQVYISIIVILSFMGWAGLARIIRGMCLSLRERDYVLAAKTFGMSDFAIIRKHILPHTISYSIFAIMLSIPGYILAESALSLIGLGIQDPYASWGNMLSDAMSVVRIKFAPWILWPAFFIFLTVICFNIIGDALRDALDPMLKNNK